MTLTNTSIFLPGGAGFMGSHLVELLSKNNQVTVYDNMTSPTVNELWFSKFPNVTFINGDIRDENKLTQAMQGAKVVIHLAVAHVRFSLSHPLEVHDVNATGTLVSLRSAKNAQVERFVYVSSSEIYGSATEPLLYEDHPKDPTTVYGVSKYVGELYTNYFYAHEGLSTQVVRLFNTYGPRAHFEQVFGEVIPRMCIRALAGKPPVIFGTGQQTRDFTFITDSMAGLMQAASSSQLVGKTINIAYGREITLSQVADIICKKTGYDGPLIAPARPHDVMRHAADTTQAKQLLGWNPKVDIEKGISQYIDWLKKEYPDPAYLLNQIPDTNW